MQRLEERDAEKFFAVPKICEIFETVGTHCFLELNVGPALQCI